MSNAKSAHRLLPWFVWSLGAAFFFCDYFARVSINVMANDLMRAFSVTALGLGSLSAFFYYPYIFMQIPVGLLVDRLGVRRLLITMAFLTGTGCILFANAHHLPVAQMGRLLIGFGAAFAFVSTLKLASIWFPARQFGTLAGLTQGLGMFGAFVGGGPVAASVAAIGWRNTMLVMAVVFFVLTLLIAWIVQDKPDSATPVAPAEKQGLSSVLHSLKLVLRNPQSWYNGLYAGLLYAPTAAFAELWGSTYLVHVQGLSMMTAAYANGIIFLGWGFGGPWIGWLSDKWQSRRKVMFLSSICGFVLISILLFTAHLSHVAIFTILFLYGLTNAAVATSYAVAAEINPAEHNGASMAFANMMSVIVGACLQPLIGWFIDLQAGQHSRGVGDFVASDFQHAMMLLPICFIVSFVLILFIKESFPKHHAR